MEKQMIFLLFVGSVSYVGGLLGCAAWLGLLSKDLNKNRIKCDFKKEATAFFAQILIFALAVYIYLLTAVSSYYGDSGYFYSVIAHFLESEQPFLGYYVDQGIVYPPLFMYLYYILSKLIGLFQIPLDWKGSAFILMVKLPGIVSVFLMAWMLFAVSKQFFDKRQRTFVLLAVLLNPAYIFTSGFICQVDALYVCLLLLTVVLLWKNHLKWSYFSFAAAILCKFQAIFITPVLLCAAFEEVFLHDFTWKKLRQHACAGIGAVACLFLSYVPFELDVRTRTWQGGGLMDNFTTSIQSYGFASQNTFNLWTLLGYNLRSQELACGPFTCHTWGTLFLVILTVGSVWIFFWKRNNQKLESDMYPMLAAMLVSGVVCFATKMMPRYLYPAVVCLTLGYICKPTRRRLYCMISYIICFLWLVVGDYMIYPISKFENSLLIPKVTAIFFLACHFYLIATMIREKID